MKLVLCIAFLTRPGSWRPCRGARCPPGAATRWWHRWTPGPNRQHCLGSTWVILSRLSPYQEGYNFQVIEEFVTGRQLTALCSRAGSQQILGLLMAKPFGPPNDSDIWLSSSVSEGRAMKNIEGWEPKPEKQHIRCALWGFLLHPMYLGKGAWHRCLVLRAPCWGHRSPVLGLGAVTSVG